MNNIQPGSMYKNIKTNCCPLSVTPTASRVSMPLPTFNLNYFSVLTIGDFAFSEINYALLSITIFTQVNNLG
jgi:hypothetical protein